MSGRDNSGLIRRVLVTCESVLMVTAFGWGAFVVASEYESSLAATPTARVFPGVSLFGQDVGGMTVNEVEALATDGVQRQLDESITLRSEESSATATARQLGATPSVGHAVQRAIGWGRDADLLTNLERRHRATSGAIDLVPGFRFDEDVALSYLVELAPEFERASVPTRIRAATREIIGPQTGSTLIPNGSLSQLSIGLASGQTTIELVTQDKPPAEDPLAEIAQNLDITALVGSFTTPYQTSAQKADRAHNLKLGAMAIDGLILQPGEVFSFNEVVGPRSAEAGFRYAPGLAGGEVVDVLGGGICQVSSTLFGAVFFGGLEVLRARPHSRPSGYVDMGLDSTVVYPDIDMKFRNPHPWPVVLHMSVNQGTVRAEVLGQGRDFKIAFEREVVEILQHTTVYRDDSRLKTGTEAIAQRGMRGFKVNRIRKVYRNGELVNTDTWPLTYRATTQIVRRGTSPNGEVPPVKSYSPLRDPTKGLRLVQ